MPAYATMWLRVVLASFPDPGSTKFDQSRKRRTLQPGPNYAIHDASDERCSYRVELCYICLASLALSLQVTSTHISSLHEHVGSKILESLKNSSGHGLSNWTGSASPSYGYGCEAPSIP